MWERLEKNLDRYSQKERELIKKAFLLSLESHKGQTRASGEEYISHPIAVARELIRLKLDAQTVAAGLLHDALEDTKLSKDDLKNSLGEEVAFLVEALTKLDRVRYQGFERKIESTRKMFLAVAEDVRVVLIKLADRLHNMRTINALAVAKQKRIAEETLELYAPLAYRLGIGELKGQLEDLSFPIVHPDEYAWLKKETDALLPERTEYLGRITPIISAELAKGGIKKFEINFRAKHLYSLWKKLFKYNLDISRVTDIVALRIIVSSVEECYQTLGIIHALWKPVPGRIKDYVALPKPNGYQSLHTTVFCIENIMTEFQIRTHEMHEEAEYGVAAHWIYDEQGKPKKGAHPGTEKVAWVKKLAHWQKEFADTEGEEFIESLKIDFFKDRIFVLTPKGEVIDLPENSTPIDFAYHIHSEVGDHMAGAKVNNIMVAFSHALASGDTVEILTQKNKKPSPDWLAMVRSSLAKGHIRSALRRQGIEPTKNVRAKPKDDEAIIVIRRKSRIGLLKDITSALSKEKINITKTESDVHDASKPYLIIQCKIPKSCDRARLLLRLRKIKNIQGVEIKQ